MIPTWTQLFKKLWNIWFPKIYEICPDCKTPLITEEINIKLDQGESQCMNCKELERLEDERINKHNFEEWLKDARAYELMDRQTGVNQIHQGLGLQNQQQQMNSNDPYQAILNQLLGNSKLQ